MSKLITYGGYGAEEALNVMPHTDIPNPLQPLPRRRAAGYHVVGL